MSENMKIKSLIPFMCAVLACGIMFLIAELFNETEIIFPETLALLTGAWIAPKQPWNVNKKKLIICMTISAIMGICIVRFLSVPLLIKILIGFIISALILIISKCTLVPVISACILPVMLGTESIIYPVSVFCISAIVAIVQKIMENYQIREPYQHKSNEIDRIYELKKWSLLFIIFAVIAVIPVYKNMLYIIAPPMIVTFAELSCSKRTIKQILKIYAVLVFASVIGTASRLILNIHFNLPLTISAIIAVILILTVFRLLKTMFPPAGAICLLPMILNSDGLIKYPFLIAVGGIVIIISAKFSGYLIKNVLNNKSIKKEKVNAD